MVLAVPVSILTAIYLSEYAPRGSAVAKPVVDLLAGLPSVVYGVWGVLLVVPFVGNVLAPLFGVFSSGYSVLAGGIVLAIMIFPTIIHVTLEVFASVPRRCARRRWPSGRPLGDDTHVVLRKGVPGILAAVVLGLSRAFGETMAVLMVVGNVPAVPRSLFDPGYPLPALIANNYGEMMSIPRYDAALMLAALVLLLVVLLFNVLARRILVRVERRAGERPGRRRGSAAQADRGLFPGLAGSAAVVILSPPPHPRDGPLESLPALSLAMLTQTPQGRLLPGQGRRHPERHPRVALSRRRGDALAFLLSLPLALYLNVYKGRASMTAVWTRFCLDVLWGVPSIVYGAFGFVVMLALGLRASLLAGIVTVALLELPIMARAIDEVVRLVPRELPEARPRSGRRARDRAQGRGPAGVPRHRDRRS